MSRATQVVLRSEALEVAILPEVGARLHRLRAFGHDLLRTPDDASAHAADPMFWGAYPMAPWCNRAPAGATWMAGRRVELAPSFPDGSAIHGLVAARAWSHRGGGTFEVDGNAGAAGWPWSYRVRLMAAVEGATLTIELALTNLDASPMPAGLGLHPWFRTPLELTLPAASVYRSNTVSAAQPEPVAGEHDLRSPRAPASGLDGTWTALREPVVTVAWPAWGISARLAQRAAGDGLVAVASPATIDAVAIEPQTHGPDPFRRLAGGEPDPPALLAPGASLHLRLRWDFALARNVLASAGMVKPMTPTDPLAPTTDLAPPGSEAERLARGEHHDPHAILGAHAVAGGTVVRAFHPDAAGVELLRPGQPPVAMRPTGDGLWAALVPDAPPFEYRLRFAFPDGNDWERDDPYRFLPTLGELDLHLIGEGRHERLWEVLGAHPRTLDGTAGVAFAVWAPNARSVRIVGDFDRWDGRLFPMRSLGASGVWELFVPDIGHGELYKYEVVGRDGTIRLKADPLSFAMQVRPETASRVWDLDADAGHWTDEAWMAERARRDPYRSPMAVYEVHLGSWMRNPDGSWLGYRQAAERLAEHCRRYGFTHVELLPVAEHPFDGSWGYQVTGYFAPTARFGSPDDFRHMVDTLHNAGIGVLLDWVPAHFPTDDFALRRFDGTPLYEHPDPHRGEHPDWGTLIFDFGRPEVRNFLVANALFWLDRYHIDGLRVDAVASMLYLDYSRKAGEWTPNQYGGNENLEAIAFLREMNEKVYAAHPGAVTIAEESTAFPGVSRPTYLGGLGFGFKWDMGWMHDTLAYFSEDPVHRRFHHDKLTFRALYKDTEHFVLPLSHDEVVHGKGSLLGKMPGDEWQRFANLRTLLAEMYTQPGKKLLFMGSELAPWQEWDHDRALPWDEADAGLRAGFGRFLADLGAVYQATPALWAADVEPDGFAWIDASDVEASVYSYIRRAGEEQVVVVLNMTPVPRRDYRLGLPAAGRWEEALNTDSEHYGGSNIGNLGGVTAGEPGWHGQPASATLSLPPLSALVLRRAD